MNVGYFGPLRDHSGYGETSRHHVAALDAAGITVVPEVARYTMDNANYGPMGEVVDRLLQNRGEDYRIKLLHTTPNAFKRQLEPGKYHIGFMYWETSKVPEDFAAGLRLCDEVWTACQANVEAIRAAGVDKPVYVFPQPIQTLREPVERYELPGFDGFLFYSVFEWTDRKNPEALLRAYWHEFSASDNVGLLLKTYFRNFTYVNKRMIRERITNLKDRFISETGMSVDEVPPVYIYNELMDRRQVQRLHTTGDCFVSATRGEGWGVPQAEAMLAGKPVITTESGGISEYMTDGEDAYLVPVKMVPVRGMTHSSEWYSSDQKWAEVDPQHLQTAMRYARGDRQGLVEIGQAGQRLVQEQFSLEKVGQLMANRLAEIERAL